MDALTGMLNSFALAHPWIPLVGFIYMGLVKIIVGVRDSTDKTPLVDNNWFERISTILGKTIGYLGGLRPKVSEEVKEALPPVLAKVADAAGVVVKAEDVKVKDLKK